MYDFIKDVITELVKRGIFDLDGQKFCEYCRKNDFIPWRIKDEILEFKKTEEGQKFIVKL